MTVGVAGWPAQCERVVFFARRTPETSGGAKVVETLSHALRSRGVIVEHVSLEPGRGDPAFPTYVVDARPDWHRRSSFRARGGSITDRAKGLVEVVVKRVDRLRNRLRLRRHLTTFGPETAFVFTHVSAKIVVDETGWVRSGDGPILIGQHHSQFESIDLEEWLRGAIIHHFQDLDVFVALTDDDAAKFQEILRPPCVAVSNPVPPPTSDPRTPRSLAVAISRLSGEKAIEVMIRCFAAATSEPGLEHWQLDIHGEGDQLERLREEIVASGATNIRLAGHCDDVYDVLADASVLLMTSWMEGLPMSILEAGAMGVPTIAFDCSPGVHSLIGHERGVLVPPEDEEEYTRVLASTLHDPGRLRDLGEAARELATQHSPDRILERWATVLTSSYASRPRRSP